MNGRLGGWQFAAGNEGWKILLMIKDGGPSAYCFTPGTQRQK